MNKIFICLLFLALGIFAFIKISKKEEKTISNNVKGMAFFLKPTPDESSILEYVFVSTFGFVKDQIRFTITYNSGIFAKGDVTVLNDMKNYHWIAAKSNTRWLLLYSGEGPPSCKTIDYYHVPNYIASTCKNEKGKEQKRVYLP